MSASLRILGNGNALFLPAGQLYPLADFGVITVFQAHDKVMGVVHPSGGDNFGLAGPGGTI